MRTAAHPGAVLFEHLADRFAEALQPLEVRTVAGSVAIEPVDPSCAALRAGLLERSAGDEFGPSSPALTEAVAQPVARGTLVSGGTQAGKTTLHTYAA